MAKSIFSILSKKRRKKSILLSNARHRGLEFENDFVKCKVQTVVLWKQ